jgi:hypothetical protein
LVDDEIVYELRVNFARLLVFLFDLQMIEQWKKDLTNKNKKKTNHCALQGLLIF